MNPMYGDLFKIIVKRIPDELNLEFDSFKISADHDCGYGEIDGPQVSVGLIHTEKDDSSWFIVYSEGSIIAEGDDREDVAIQAIEVLKDKLQLTCDEIHDLFDVFNVEECPDFDELDEELWQYSLGEFSEVDLGDDPGSFSGGLIVAIFPFYSTEIDLFGATGDACADDALAECDIFGGARRPNN
ncbi:MAG: hypothetical protein AB7I29_13805 [Geobacter sp.]